MSGDADVTTIALAQSPDLVGYALQRPAPLLPLAAQ
jgi:hypothetical protein